MRAVWNVVKAWWHARRYVDCQVCGREFRKGSGGGVSGEVFCSGWCYGVNFGQWMALITKKGGAS